MISSCIMEGKELSIITGASKGFGLAIAVEVNNLSPFTSLQMAKKFPKMDFVLASRDEEGLKKTKEAVQTHLEKDCTVMTHKIDLSDLDHLDSNLDALFDRIQGNFRRVFAFSNAGSATPLVAVSDLSSCQQVRKEIDLNVTSTVVFNARLLKRFHHLVLVNISSLCAIKPFHSVGVYSVGKAAR